MNISQNTNLYSNNNINNQSNSISFQLQQQQQQQLINQQNFNYMNNNIDDLEEATEVLNIIKVKEGFYVGDQIAGTNLEVVLQFKLTHMINAAGNEVKNTWENIGIKYLTLNWAEKVNQNLFDSKDEIANKIVQYIDDSLIKGEGLLAYSVNGKNRVCIVVLIYLMKKYKWSLDKSMEYLKCKKTDVEIPMYFMNQLKSFENRLMNKGEIKLIPWSEENIPDQEERLLRNTYINGIPNNPNKIIKTENKNKKKRNINWADNNPYKKQPLEVINLQNDLFFQKDVKTITSHLNKRPSRSCVKNKSNYINNNSNINDNYIENNIMNRNNNFVSKSTDKINLNNNNSYDYLNNSNLTPDVWYTLPRHV